MSWVVSSNDVVEDADLSEEVAPALLVDSAGLWKQAYPSSNVLGDSVESPGELVKPENDNVAQLSSSRLFSYRLEKVKKSGGSGPPPPPHQETARTARYIAHYSDWGHLATISTLDKVMYVLTAVSTRLNNLRVTTLVYTGIGESHCNVRELHYG